MDNDMWKNILDSKENIEHIKQYIPPNTRVLYIGDCNSELYKQVNVDIKDNLKVIDSSLITISDSVLSFALNSLYLLKNGYFELVIIDLHNTEELSSAIKNVIHNDRPNVLIINHTNSIYRYSAIYDNSNIFRQYDYILEINNTQYVLIQKDCYSVEN